MLTPKHPKMTPFWGGLGWSSGGKVVLLRSSANTGVHCNTLVVNTTTVTAVGVVVHVVHTVYVYVL